MGRSFGFNRNEDVEDYQTAQSLIHLLIEIVSRGGNLLLNIGPDSDGTIPVIMQERLLQMGEWLQVNGEAIHGSRIHRSHGESDSVRFTRSADGSFVYAILLRHPGRQVRLKTVEASPDVKIHLLGLDRDLGYRQEGEELVIDLPESALRKMPCEHAWVFKIPAKPYVEAPVLQTASFISVDKPLKLAVAIEPADARAYYTLDGSEPTPQSASCSVSLTIQESALFKVRAFKEGFSPSLTVQQPVSILNSKVHGLDYAYYEGEWPQLPDFTALKAVKKGRTYDFSLAPVMAREDKFALTFSGFIEITTAGLHRFYTESDDGSRLYIDGQLVVDNDGLHGAKEAQGKIELAPGRHALLVTFMEAGGAETLKVMYQTPGSTVKAAIPPSLLYHRK